MYERITLDHKLQVSVYVLQLFGREFRRDYLLAGELRSEFERNADRLFRVDFSARQTKQNELRAPSRHYYTGYGAYLVVIVQGGGLFLLHKNSRDKIFVSIFVTADFS